jgi:ABC-2 type transport system permease protein
MLKAAWALAKKDILSYLRDRTALMLGFLVPIVLVTVFGIIMTYAFGGSSGMPRVTIWVVDEDQTEESKKVVDRLRESNMLNVRPKADEKAVSAEAVRNKVAKGDANHGLIVPKGYGASKKSDSAIDVQVVRDPGRVMEDRILQMALMQSLMMDDQGQMWQRSMQKMFREDGMSEEQLKQLDQAMQATTSTISKYLESAQSVAANPAGTSSESSNSNDDDKSDANDNESDLEVDPMQNMARFLPIDFEDVEPPDRSSKINFQQAQSIAGMAVMMLLFGMTGAGAILLAEREQGTLKRLLAMPIRPESILFGKFGYVFVLGLAQMMVMLTYGEQVFRVGLFRDPLTLIVLVITWVATASAFGMAIATFATSSKQAEGMSTVLILAMAALGGCWFPIQMLTLPTAIDILSKSTMTYWAMEGFQGLLWNNLSLTDGKMLRAVSIQWIWTFALLGLTMVMFRRNYIR